MNITEEKLDLLNSELAELEGKLRDVQSVIRFLQYGGDDNQKSPNTDLDFNDANRIDSDGGR